MHTVGSMTHNTQNLHHWVDIPPWCDVTVNPSTETQRVHRAFFSIFIPSNLDLLFVFFLRCTFQFDVLPDGDAFFLLPLFLFKPTLKWNSFLAPSPTFLFFFFIPICCLYLLYMYMLPAEGLSHKALVLRNVWDSSTVTFRGFYTLAECLQANTVEDERSSIIVALQ